MNRKQRRLLAKAKPAKQPRRNVMGNMLVAGYRVLWPLDSIIARLDIDGTVDTVKGKPVFDDGDDVYEIVPAMQGLTDWFERAAKQMDVSINLDPMYALEKCFDYGMPVTETHMKNIKALMPKLRAFLSRMPADIGLSTLTTVQIDSYIKDEK